MERYLAPRRADPGPQRAHGLLAYADLDVDHLICNLIPSTSETVSELTKALRLLRGMSVGTGNSRPDCAYTGRA